MDADYRPFARVVDTGSLSTTGGRSRFRRRSKCSEVAGVVQIPEHRTAPTIRNLAEMADLIGMMVRAGMWSDAKKLNILRKAT